jgi:hypothetical protein
MTQAQAQTWGDIAVELEPQSENREPHDVRTFADRPEMSKLLFCPDILNFLVHKYPD